MRSAEELEQLKKSYTEILGRMAAAASSAGRSPEEIMLVPAVKYADAEQINYLHDECGLNDIGENRVQTLLEHLEGIKHPENLNIHFIGSLQKNKVKYIIGKVCMIHSLDSEELAAEIEKQAAKAGIVQEVLVEINSSREDSKGGVLPENAEEFCTGLAKYPHIRLRGFMTMGAKYEKTGDYYNNFIKIYNLTLDIWQKKLHNITRPFLSMGMTDSFEPAIAAGSSCVRVGRAIFGGNPAAAEKTEENINRAD